jgi:hypothetical protein
MWCADRIHAHAARLKYNFQKSFPDSWIFAAKPGIGFRGLLRVTGRLYGCGMGGSTFKFEREIGTSSARAGTVEMQRPAGCGSRVNECSIPAPAHPCYLEANIAATVLIACMTMSTIQLKGVLVLALLLAGIAPGAGEADFARFR